MLLYKKHKGVDDVKHLRKTVSILALSAALLCVLCSVAFAASNNDTAFAVSESGATGDIINVDVYLSGKDIGSVYIDLEYDNTALEFVSARTFVAGLRFNYNSSTVLSGGNIVRFTGSVDSYDALNVNGAVMRVELKILKSDVRPQIKISGKSYGTDGASRGSLSYSGFINVYNYDSETLFCKDTETAGNLYSAYKNISNSVKIVDYNGVTVRNDGPTVRTGDKVIINDKITKNINTSDS